MISPHVIRKTTNPSSPPTETGIHWINVITNEEFFSVGITSLDDWMPRKKSGFKSYTITITATNIANKSVILPYTPVSAEDVMARVVGGIDQLNGIDFEVTGNVLSWDGLGLDNFLEETDVLIIQH